MSLTIEERVPLAPYTTMHVGGPARYVVSIQTFQQLLDALSFASDKDIPIFCLGGGSNILIPDEGFPGCVLKMEARGITISGREVTAEAGAITRLVAMKAVEHGLLGLESIAGIPGTIGGAVCGNAGSFGAETKDHVARVTVLRKTTRKWEQETLPKESIQFSYRSSMFKKDRSYVIWDASFMLQQGDPEQGMQDIAKDMKLRKQKQPYDFPSMGSVFRNPSPNVFAGKLIDEAGLKGYTIGGAMVSEKHANFIVNRGNATATDIMRLIQYVEKQVEEHSGIRLEREAVLM